MTSKNDITGDKLATKPASEAYRENWDRIFGKRSVTLVTNLPNGELSLLGKMEDALDTFVRVENAK